MSGGGSRSSTGSPARACSPSAIASTGTGDSVSATFFSCTGAGGGAAAGGAGLNVPRAVAIGSLLGVHRVMTLTLSCPLRMRFLTISSGFIVPRLVTKSRRIGRFMPLITTAFS